MTKRKRITVLIMSFIMAFMLTVNVAGTIPPYDDEPEYPTMGISPFSFKAPGNTIDP